MGKITDSQINEVLDKYTGGFEPTCRYVSFDLCHGYFKRNKDHLLGENLDKSCHVLWSYLASWGMLRGSSYLLKYKNPLFLKPLIEYIADEKNRCLFDIDVDTYEQENSISCLMNAYKDITQILTCEQGNPTVTLITKIMLGVWANIPAFDTNFKASFRKYYGSTFARVDRRSLQFIGQFYMEHKDCIDNKEYRLYDFNGNQTDMTYSKAKIIDMIGWQDYLE